MSVSDEDFRAALVARGEALMASGMSQAEATEAVVKEMRESGAAAPVASAAPVAAAPTPPPAFDPFGDRDPTAAELAAMSIPMLDLVERGRPGAAERVAGRQEYERQAAKEAERVQRKEQERAHEELLRTDPQYAEKHYQRGVAERFGERFWGMSEKERLDQVSKIGGELGAAGLDAQQQAALEASVARLEDVPEHEAARGGVQGFEVGGMLAGPGGEPRLVRFRG
jgi:uncharacterized protein YoaH (UPF0181 family)